MPVKYTAAERLELAIERGFITDPEDQWLLESYTWHASGGGGYAGTHVPGTSNATYLHHCIVGYPIDGSEVDHINRNKKDNRRSNLRYVSRGQNQLNSDRSDTSYSIYPVTRSDTYQVIIVRDQIRHYLGVFDTIEAAEEARDTWLSSEQGT